MSFLDALGGIASGIGSFTGLDDAWHDLGTAFADVGNDHNYIAALGQTLRAVGEVPANTAFNTLSAATQFPGISQAIQADLKAVSQTTKFLGYASALGHSDALHGLGQSWQRPGESFGDYSSRAWDSTVGQEDNNAPSLGQISAAGGEFGPNSLQAVKDNADQSNLAGTPLDWNQEQRDKVFGAGVNELASGTSDLIAVTLVDPVNLLPGVGKAARAASAGKYIVSESPGFLRGAFSLTRDQAGRILDAGLDDPSSPSGRLFAWIAKSDEATIEKSPIAQQSANPAAFAAILGPTKNVEEARAAFQIVTKVGDVEGARNFLLDAAAKNGESPLSRQYLIDRVLKGAPEPDSYDGLLVHDPVVIDQHQQILAEHLADPESSVARAYQQALDKANSDVAPLLERAPGTNAFLSFNESMATRRASRLGNLGPDVTTYQRSSLHPIIAVADFFTRERSSGYIQFHHSDSVNEIHAMVGDLDAVTQGGMQAEGEGRAWINQYISATQIPDQMRLAQGLERRGFELLAAKHGMGVDEAQNLYNQFSSRRAQAMQRYADKGFISAINDGGDAYIAKIPILERQAANVLPLADFREIDKVLSRHDQSMLRAVFSSSAGAVYHGMDVVNDIFKMSVLFRFGYTIRNLSEAFASMFVSGYLGHAVLSSGADVMHNLNAGTRARFNRISNNVGVWTGAKRDLEAGRVDLSSAEGVVRARRNILEGIRTALDQGTIYHDPETLDLIRRWQAGELTSPEANEQARQALVNVRNLARMRGETTRTRTYHTTTDPNFSTINGDYLDTVPSHGVAFAQADARAHTYLSYENAGDRVTGVPTDKPLAGERRAATQDRYSTLLDNVEQALNDGKVVETTRGAAWVRVTPDTLSALRDRAFHNGAQRRVFRVRDENVAPDVVPIHSYGDELDLTKYAGMPEELRSTLGITQAVPGRRGLAHSDWVKNEGWNDPAHAQALVDYARANGIGRIVLPSKEWGQTVRVIKDTVDGFGGRGSSPLLDRSVQQLTDEATAEHGVMGIIPPEKRTWAQNRADRRRALRDASAGTGRARLTGVPVNRQYQQDYVQAMLDKGAPDAIKQAIGDLAEAEARAEGARTQLAQIQQRMARGKRPARAGSSPMTVMTQYGPHTVPGAFGGTAGDIMARATHGDPNYDHLVGSGEGIYAQAIPTSVNVPIKPSDPNYFTGWANMLNWHWRDPATGAVDPMIDRLLTGQTPTEVSDWLKNTAKGRTYADSLGWGTSQIDEAVQTAAEGIRAYIPNPQVEALWRTGKLDEEGLSAMFGGRTDLPDLNGLLVPQSREYADRVAGQKLLERGVRKAFHFLGALPETTFARHPLFRAYYDREMPRLVAHAANIKGAPLTLDEINSLALRTQENARKVVNKTLFTINRRTGASQNMRLIAPFYAAWENTIQRWGGFAIHDTEGLVRGGAYLQRFMNNATLVNTKTGEPGVLGKDQNADLAMVLPFKIGGWDANVPIASLDVLFQGQPLNPGIGPFAALPMEVALQKVPSSEQIFGWAFPAGQPRGVEGVVSSFFPAALKRMISYATEDQSFQNDANRIAMQEYINYLDGKRGDIPQWSEIESKTRQFYALKALTNLTAPASITYQNDVNYYQNELRKYRAMYGTQADAKFLQDRPEAFVVMEPLSNNPSGVRATLSTVDNLKRYSDLAALAQGTDPEMIGWIGNYGQGTYDPNAFSQAAYNWELGNAPVTGADNYRTKKNPMELIQDAKVNAGWVQYRQYMDMGTAQLTAQGIDPASAQGQKAMQNLRHALSNVLMVANPDWYAAYSSPDRSKYDKRATFLESVLTDKNFMADHGQDPTIQSVAAFLQLRSQMAQNLITSQQVGGSRRIGAKSNTQIALEYNGAIERLKAENLGFADLYDRYFANDPVTL